MNNIFDKFKQISLIIINNVDPINKNIGRPTVYNYESCLNIIFFILKTGNSWNSIDENKNKLDAIRKRYHKWISLNIFNNAYSVLLKLYKLKYKTNNFYIDSTVISNRTGSLHFGYNIKIKNKKSIKITPIIDDNQILYMFKVTPSNLHDVKIMENIINVSYCNNIDLINLIGDKGYIKPNDYINNINLITPLKKNAKNKKLLEENKILLKKRHIVENFFSFLKRSFNRISLINDKVLKIYENYIYMASSIILLRISERNNLDVLPDTNLKETILYYYNIVTN
jgi:transposase